MVCLSACYSPLPRGWPPGTQPGTSHLRRPARMVSVHCPCLGLAAFGIPKQATWGSAVFLSCCMGKLYSEDQLTQHIASKDANTVFLSVWPCASMIHKRAQEGCWWCLGNLCGEAGYCSHVLGLGECWASQPSGQHLGKLNGALFFIKKCIYDSRYKNKNKN